MGTFGSLPFYVLWATEEPFVVYEVGWRVCWLSAVDGIWRSHLNKPCRDTVHITWENVINYSDHYECINLTQCSPYLHM